ncbi:hypothetical protein [Bacillus cereus]|uniref:hypothetical protein n=1 Tax=Bacillus cereus TaxID=1396 RepID=UPI0018CE1E7F|nr:hypothetical protein [Bacillus cereus]MBG9716010.1 hypothetical protein [Bacillus cereus]
MKNHWKTILFFISIITIVVLTYYLCINDKDANLLSDKDIQNTNFLNDKKAVVYVSSTADQDLDGKGVSYAIFINKQGIASGYKMGGLELGGIGVSDDKKQVLLESKDNIKFLGENPTTHKIKYQHTGDFNGYLASQKIFVNIYNSGMNKENGNYDSNVLFGNEKGIHKSNIPHFIISSGLDGENILVATQDLVTNKYELERLTFNDTTMNIANITELNVNGKEDHANLSPILVDSENYYMVMSTIDKDDPLKGETFLLRTNKTTLEQNTIFMYKEENSTATSPFSLDNSAYIYNDELYFINGLGEVYTYNPKNDAMSHKFSIDYHVKDGVRYNEQTYFENDSLYVLRYDAKRNNKYYIERYNLTNGKKVSEQEIQGIESILATVKGRKKVYAYDFKMLLSKTDD